MMLPIQWWVRELWRMGREFTCSEHGNDQILLLPLLLWDGFFYFHGSTQTSTAQPVFNFLQNISETPNPWTNINKLSHLSLQMSKGALTVTQTDLSYHQLHWSCGQSGFHHTQTTAGPSLTSQMLWRLVGWFNMCSPPPQNCGPETICFSPCCGRCYGTCISTLSQ